MATAAHELENIGEEMVDAGVISHDQLAVAEESKKNLGGDLGHILIKKGFVSEEQILEFFSKCLKIPFVSLADYAIDAENIKIVPASIAQKYHFIPLERTDDTLTIALAHPLDVFSIDDIRGMVKYRIQPVLARADEISQLLREHYRPSLAEDEAVGDIEVTQFGAESDEEAAERLQEMASGRKVIAEVNRIILGAIRQGASDIHIEPMESDLRIRDRIDGVLEERVVLPKSMHLPVISRIKVMAGMDIAERRIPQDGRVCIRSAGRRVDMRISTYPTMYGEKVVIRLLSTGKTVTIEQLGLTDQERKTLELLISKPHGMLLVTGPTGSGKTTTLYGALQRINSQDKNIISIEDPIENEMPGVNQAQVNLKAGMTFASALRSILRQDPDVIMIGEIRDRETADISVRAAITGHLVFSTLHTNTAIGAVSRLADLGVEPFLLSSALNGLIAQRLVRCICPHCTQPADIPAEKRRKLGLAENEQLYRGKGCKRCRMSGYAGRVGLFEFVAITPELRQLIASQATEDELINVWRKAGGRSLKDVGIALLKKGKTTVEEMLRVIETME